MTRKDFRAVAAALAAAMAHTTDTASLWSAAELIADHFATVNPRFDRAKFLAAVGQ